ncbi:unnamed protein product [Mytilus edulis]|uniref:Reverse transcriptase domain-containing protein n=1 Tax=Mytilus edulis TaxID=6550 RepID=A0A8S3V4Q0_MYTED|nr:unnamed protein product [Mytilus edulis]
MKCGNVSLLLCPITLIDLFRRKTDRQLLEVLDEWSELIDSGFPLDSIFLDFSKAFDTVPHQRLFLKLEKLGIKGCILNWIKSFLSGRKQCVLINNTTSTWSDVVSGVPQGSVLGPVLFLTFINDLPDVVEGIVKVFADDCKVYSKVSSDYERCKLQENLDRLCEWSDMWKLKFNAAKCKVLHINPDNDLQYRYTMLDESGNFICIITVNEEKDLGVTFESNLKFEKHISDIYNKAQRVLSLIHHSFDYMDQDMFLTIYKSIVRPLLEYATCVWSPYLKKDIRKLESVQRRATKLVKNICHLNYEDRLRSLGLPTLEYRRDRNDMIQVYKALHGIDDIDWMRLFTLAPSNNTRGHSLKLLKKQCKTTHRLNTFSIRVVDQWNNLCASEVECYWDYWIGTGNGTECIQNGVCAYCCQGSNGKPCNAVTEKPTSLSNFGQPQNRAYKCVVTGPQNGNTIQECPLSERFCLNDVIYDTDPNTNNLITRDIIFRCATQEQCKGKWLQSKNINACLTGNMTGVDASKIGNMLLCHYCCESNTMTPCNLHPKPDQINLFIQPTTLPVVSSTGETHAVACNHPSPSRSTCKNNINVIDVRHEICFLKKTYTNGGITYERGGTNETECMKNAALSSVRNSDCKLSSPPVNTVCYDCCIAHCPDDRFCNEKNSISLSQMPSYMKTATTLQLGQTTTPIPTTLPTTPTTVTTIASTAPTTVLTTSAAVNGTKCLVCTEDQRTSCSAMDYNVCSGDRPCCLNEIVYQNGNGTECIQNGVCTYCCQGPDGKPCNARTEEATTNLTNFGKTQNRDASQEQCKEMVTVEKTGRLFNGNMTGVDASKQEIDFYVIIAVNQCKHSM